jgi:hypothetical protein
MYIKYATFPFGMYEKSANVCVNARLLTHIGPTSCLSHWFCTSNLITLSGYHCHEAATNFPFCHPIIGSNNNIKLIFHTFHPLRALAEAAARIFRLARTHKQTQNKIQIDLETQKRMYSTTVKSTWIIDSNSTVPTSLCHLSFPRKFSH